MKKISLFFILSLLFLGCSQKEKISESSNLKPKGEALKISISQTNNLNTRVECSGVSFGRAWNVATCKSNCGRGIGFRCGGYDYVRDCNGVETIVRITPARCKATPLRQGSAIPSVIVESDTTWSRPGKGIFDFYNNVMKITFTSPMIQYATNPNTAVLDVEADTDISIPNAVINGITYNWVVVKKGVYYIDWTLGAYGAVFVNYELY